MARAASRGQPRERSPLATTQRTAAAAAAASASKHAFHTLGARPPHCSSSSRHALHTKPQPELAFHPSAAALTTIEHSAATIQRAARLKATRRRATHAQQRYAAYLDLMLSANLVKPSKVRSASTVLRHLDQRLATLQPDHAVSVGALRPLLAQLLAACEAAYAAPPPCGVWRRAPSPPAPVASPVACSSTPTSPDPGSSAAAGAACSAALAEAGAARISVAAGAEVLRLRGEADGLRAEVARLQRELLRERERADVLGERLADRERALDRAREVHRRGATAPQQLLHDAAQEKPRSPAARTRGRGAPLARGRGATHTSPTRRTLSAACASSTGAARRLSPTPRTPPGNGVVGACSSARWSALRGVAEKGMGTGAGVLTWPPLPSPPDTTWASEPLSHLSSLQNQLRGVYMRASDSSHEARAGDSLREYSVGSPAPGAALPAAKGAAPASSARPLVLNPSSAWDEMDSRVRQILP